MKVAGSRGRKQEDLDDFGCGYSLKTKWAERVMFFRAQMSTNRFKFLAEREEKEPYGFPRLFSRCWTRVTGSAHRIFHRMIWANLDQLIGAINIGTIPENRKYLKIIRIFDSKITRV